MLLAVVSLVVSGNALAQCHDDPDEICIIFDYPDECCDNCLPPPVSGIIHAYVVLHNPSTPGGVFGFEFRLCNSGGGQFAPPAGSYVLAYNLPVGCLNVSSPPEFVCGCAAPIPWSTCVLLVDMEILYMSQDCWCFGVEPTFSPSIPDHMAFVDGDDPGHLLPMLPCTGPIDGMPQESCTMACINCADCPTGPIGADKSTWGYLKALYD